MPKEPTTKKELSLIESIIEHSKEILGINNVILLARAMISEIANGKYNPLDSQNINLKSIIKEFETRREELQVHMANMLKVAYSHQYDINITNFHLSSVQMAAGYAMFAAKKNGETKWVVLFLSDCQPDFLDPIKPGEMYKYTEELEKDYLNHCKPVWTANHFNDLRMENLKIMMTS